MTPRPLVLAAALLLAACAPRASRTGAVMPTRVHLRQFAESLATQPEFRNAHLGLLVVDPATGDTLISRNAGKLFMPASNMKLVTGAVALTLLGPDHRWRTEVAAAGTMRRDTLLGDLVILGHGDPSFSDAMQGDAMAPLRAMADSLVARGIRVVRGRLLAGGDAFPDSTLGYGWAWDDLDYAYSAGVDELTFNEGFARVVVRGGAREGDPVTVETGPARSVPSILPTDSVRTVAAGGRARVRWESEVRGDRPLLRLRGTVPAGDSAVLEVALRDPTGAWLDAFTEALSSRGITVTGGVEYAERRPADGLTPLFTWSSPTLAEVLPKFEKPSQNQIGELLLRTLGAERAGVGTADSGRRVVERQLLAWGADSGGFAVRDGSGLSRHDYLSPETIVRLLDAMRQSPHFATFHAALPIAGVDGTIRARMRGTAAQGNVHAKTGTIDKARSLSGYMTTADGRLLLFSFLANNFTVPYARVEAVQDAILVRLAGTALGRR